MKGLLSFSPMRAKARAVVDRDLLDLGRVGELLILSPADALVWVAQL